MACEHKRKVRQMEWPDGGTSELCEDCLLTRHVDVITTEWQDHGYKSPADWYNEAEKLQRGMDKSLEEFRSKNGMIGRDTDR